MFIYINVISYYNLFLCLRRKQVVIGNNIDVNEHEGLPNITLRHTLKQREQAVIGNNIDVNEHEEPPNITLRHKLKQGNFTSVLLLYPYLLFLANKYMLKLS
jgi:hypothetical protein